MKTNARRIIAILLICIMALSLSACSSDSGTIQSNTSPTFNIEPEATAEPTEEPTEEPTAEPAATDASEATADETEASDGFLSNVAGLPDTLENPNISIVYWYNEKQYAYDTSKNANVYDPILEAIPYFEEKYGGEVKVIYAAWGDMLSTVISLQQAGDAPDLFEVYDESLYNVILSGVAMSIDDYITENDISYYNVDMDTFRWKGSTYAIPLKPYTFYIMFNRDLFELEGLKTPDEMFRDGEWNWDNFAKVCKALTKTVDGETTQLAYGSYNDTILSFMYANGTSLLNVDTTTGTVTSNLGAPKVQNTLDYLISLKDCFVYDNDMWGWFDNGTMAMIRGKEFPVNLPFDVGMAPFPTGSDAEGKNLVVYPQGMAVPNGSKNPAGAVAFMRIVNELQQTVGNQKEAARIGQENYDMIYADDVKLVYNYDKGLNDISRIIGTIVNYINEGVPAATIYANVESELESEIELRYGK